MSSFMLQILLAIISVAATVLSGYAVALLQKQHKEKAANNRGTMIMLQSFLIEYHENWTGRGFVTTNGLRTFEEMYEIYKDLGGNGLIDSLKKDVEGLPIKG